MDILANTNVPVNVEWSLDSWVVRYLFALSWLNSCNCIVWKCIQSWMKVSSRCFFQVCLLGCCLWGCSQCGASTCQACRAWAQPQWAAGSQDGQGALLEVPESPSTEVNWRQRCKFRCENFFFFFSFCCCYTWTQQMSIWLDGTK